MNRLALRVEYDGSGFAGLQRQRDGDRTIQGEIERVTRTLGASEDVHFAAAGRTDSGVHALGQVVAVDAPPKLELRRAGRSFNALLPPDVRVREVAEVPAEWSPRFDAAARSYRYLLVAGVPMPPLIRNMAAWTPLAFDRDLAVAAARSFRGRWELGEWRSSICQATRTLLTIDEADAIPPSGSGHFGLAYEISFRARSFLHHQVRLMVGGVAAVATGKLALAELQSSLAAGKRPQCATNFPACGLTFMRVDFVAGKDPFQSDLTLNPVGPTIPP